MSSDEGCEEKRGTSLEGDLRGIAGKSFRKLAFDSGKSSIGDGGGTYGMVKRAPCAESLTLFAEQSDETEDVDGESSLQRFRSASPDSFAECSFLQKETRS